MQREGWSQFGLPLLSIILKPEMGHHRQLKSILRTLEEASDNGSTIFRFVNDSFQAHHIQEAMDKDNLLLVVLIDQLHHFSD